MEVRKDFSILFKELLMIQYELACRKGFVQEAIAGLESWFQHSNSGTTWPYDYFALLGEKKI